jgi:hypothetical protein
MHVLERYIDYFGESDVYDSTSTTEKARFGRHEEMSQQLRSRLIQSSESLRRHYLPRSDQPLTAEPSATVWVRDVQKTDEGSSDQP